ncbi:MAG: DUF4856 domain-containing protein [Salibacteraceae bacterium]
MNYTLKSAVMLATVLATLQSCDKDPVEFSEPKTPVPSTYSFDNVNYSGQTARLNQLEELSAYLKTANTSGVELDVEVIRAMFENSGGDGNGNFSFSSDKQLVDKCFQPHLDRFDDYFIQIAAASTSNEPASNGVAGVMVDGDKSYLFDENGFEYTQLIEKGIMGAVFYYQATEVYLGSSKMNVDNETVEEGKGTAMEHHWDEAYGYLGVTNDFPENTEDIRFWGKYCVSRDGLLGTNEHLSGAFRAGRAAIVLDRYDERDSAIAEIRKSWEDVSAATAVHYLNEGLANMSNDLTRNHVLSEAYAFVGNLFYNPEKRITQSEIDQVLDLIGTNLYEVNADDLQEARDLLSDIYGYEDVKTAL